MARGHVAASAPPRTRAAPAPVAPGPRGVNSPADAVPPGAPAPGAVGGLGERAVDRRDVDVHVRVSLLDGADPLRGGDQVHQAQVVAAARLERRDRVAGAAAGREHRVAHDDRRLLDALGHLAVVLDRLAGRLVAVHADVTHARERHELEQAVDHAQPRAQDRDDRHEAVLELGELVLADGGLVAAHRRLEVAGDLVPHQQRDLLQQRAEVLRRGLLATHARELVENQRVGQNVHFAHGWLPSSV